jgi:phytoene synthase
MLAGMQLDVFSRLKNGPMTARALAAVLDVRPEKLRPLLAFEAQRARQYYEAADRLLPLIEEVSQPALWAMVEIYRGILDRIEARQYDVYSDRVRLSLGDKLKILARGFGKRLL